VPTKGLKTASKKWLQGPHCRWLIIWCGALHQQKFTKWRQRNGCRYSIKDNLLLGVGLCIDAGSEDSFGDGKEDVSSLGLKLCIDKGSKDGFKDGRNDGNQDGLMLGVKLSLDKESEVGFKDGSLKCKLKSSLVSFHITRLSPKCFDWPILISSSESSSLE
jgi:hypothetical protein